MPDKPLRIVQITDTHLFGDETKELLGVNTQQSFKAVLKLLKADPKKPDLILLTGDLSQDETKESYLYLSEALKSFPVPVYWIPGNHDDAKLLATVYPRANISNLKHIVFEDWHIILLDSQKPGAVEGYLDPIQLKYLRHCLESYPEHHAFIAFHHPAVLVGSEWIDNFNLSNANELWELISSYPQVNTLLFGHVHQKYESVKNNVKCFTSPSTCVQFKANSQKFSLEYLPQGYRWFDLYPNGDLKTDICRLEEYMGEFDEMAKGY